MYSYALQKVKWKTTIFVTNRFDFPSELRKDL